jgi:hypothetical protein
MEREALENVPGCSGTGTEMEDYCYDPSDNPAIAGQPLVIMGNDDDLIGIELLLCQGDCDTDDDCKVRKFARTSVIWIEFSVFLYI